MRSDPIPWLWHARNVQRSKGMSGRTDRRLIVRLITYSALFVRPKRALSVKPIALSNSTRPRTVLCYWVRCMILIYRETSFILQRQWLYFIALLHFDEIDKHKINNLFEYNGAGALNHVIPPLFLFSVHLSVWMSVWVPVSTPLAREDRLSAVWLPGIDRVKVIHRISETKAPDLFLLDQMS